MPRTLMVPLDGSELAEVARRAGGPNGADRALLVELRGGPRQDVELEARACGTRAASCTARPRPRLSKTTLPGLKMPAGSCQARISRMSSTRCAPRIAFASGPK